MRGEPKQSGLARIRRFIKEQAEAYGATELEIIEAYRRAFAAKRALMKGGSR